MKFERSFELAIPAPDVWTALWNIERMVACVPGCTAAAAVEEGKRYQATIVEKVGPFKVEIPLDIEILDVTAGRSFQLRATGRDSRVGTEVSFVLSASLEPMGERTGFSMSVDATVVGRLVSLGQAMIKLKGDQQIGKFAQALQADLSGRRDA
jgi:carbon monoxide dehydrogenase subunit G